MATTVDVRAVAPVRSASSESGAPPAGASRRRALIAGAAAAILAAAIVGGVVGGLAANGQLFGSSSSSSAGSGAGTPSDGNGAVGGGEGAATQALTASATPSATPSGTSTPSTTRSAGASPSGTGTPTASSTPSRPASPSASPSAAAATGPGPLLVGRVVDRCIHPGTVALTFDDGPTAYTAQVLDTLATQAPDARVTFFVNGVNYGGCIYDPDRSLALQRAYASGHQIGSHTWSHADLLLQTTAGMTREVELLETALRKIIGAVPAFLRPPYGHNSPAITAFLRDRGYAIVGWDLDSTDFALQATAGITAAGFLAGIQAPLNASSPLVPHVVLSHDTNAMTTTIGLPWLLTWAAARNYRIVTVGECLGFGTPQQMYKSIVPAVEPDITWSCNV